MEYNASATKHLFWFVETRETARLLGNHSMHKRKIDMADSIYVVNVGGYIGESTKSEIEYAREHNKKIMYLEN